MKRTLKYNTLHTIFIPLRRYHLIENWKLSRKKEKNFPFSMLPLTHQASAVSSHNHHSSASKLKVVFFRKLNTREKRTLWGEGPEWPRSAYVKNSVFLRQTPFFDTRADLGHSWSNPQE